MIQLGALNSQSLGSVQVTSKSQSKSKKVKPKSSYVPYSLKKNIAVNRAVRFIVTKANYRFDYFQKPYKLAQEFVESSVFKKKVRTRKTRLIQSVKQHTRFAHYRWGLFNRPKKITNIFVSQTSPFGLIDSTNLLKKPLRKRSKTNYGKKRRNIKPNSL
uniref:ribosomal protein S7 n=1 Tax=Ishige okamurae TaxID=233772 RepID=UPI002E778853|nr:ribosomal protein S7 [Ishige okamurae]WBP70194.1 ribosomal protein S7 [Ishige okamurae]